MNRWVTVGIIVVFGILAMVAPVHAQMSEVFGAPLTNPQANSFVLSPIDGNAAAVMRRSSIAPNGSSAMVASMNGGFEYGRPAISGSLDLTSHVAVVHAVPFTCNATLGFESVGASVASALALPGERGLAHAEFGIGCQPVPGVLLSANVDQSVGAGPGLLGGVLFSATAALPDRMIASVSGLSSMPGSLSGLGALGLIWSPSPAGWSVACQAAFGANRLTPLLNDNEPDELPSRLSLSISAPLSPETSLSIGFRAPNSPSQIPSLASLPCTAIITRNM